MKSRNDEIREIGKRKGDLWDRFDRLQRNTLAFSRGKGKRRTVQLFRNYQDLADGRDQQSQRPKDQIDLQYLLQIDEQADIGTSDGSV